MPSLQVVSTPIGNLGDITYRAVEALRSADIILAEDTRRTMVLLRHYSITRRPISAHEHNEVARAEDVVGWLAEGKEIALVSDAGTPLLSDPGARIVERVIGAGYSVVPLPGPSAALAALIGSGISSERFGFWGFLPRKKSLRQGVLEEIRAFPYTSIIYESPRRLGSLLAELVKSFGGERQAVVARELTKIHEEFIRGGLAELAQRYRTEAPRGEIVLLVKGREASGEEINSGSEVAERALAEALHAAGKSARDIATELRTKLGIPRNTAYRIAQETSSTER